MASGCVLRYAGKRGVTWSIKFVDADGRQVRELLGPAPEWTRRKAEAALRNRLSDVEREGYTKPEQVTFASFATGWMDEYADAKALKRSTRSAYRTILTVHLIPAFGSLRLEEVTVDRIERHLAQKRRDGLASGTLHRQLAVLSLLFVAALRRGLVRTNPVPLVQRPRGQRRRWRILTPTEVGAVERAFDAKIAAVSGGERDDVVTARLLFVTMMGTGIRRGEALGLRWRSVMLADPLGPVLRVEETWVRNRIETPKSQAGARTIALGKRVADELFDHCSRTPFAGDDERVFANPRTGHVFDSDRFADLFGAALKAAGIEGRVRPFHDLRHSSITNAAAAGTPPEALMARAGHSDYATTRRYVDLAGERFREEADRLEERLWGASGTKSRYEVPDSSPDGTTEEGAIPLGDSALTVFRREA